MKKIIIAVSAILLIAACKNKNQEAAKPHIESMAEIFPKPKVEIKTVGIYLYDGYSALDALGPYSVFTRLMGSHVFFIAKHKGIVEDGAGLKVQVDTTIDEVKHLDILLIPGGLAQTYQETKDEALLNWIRSIDSTSKYTTSVCTGAWILGATGLLKDKEATTHWYGKKILANDFGAKIQDKRYTHTGKYWTAAGVSAGIDMSLALLNEIAGEKYTRAAMLDLEYDPQPPFKGGNENTADKNMVEGMRALYDGGMETALHPEKAFKEMKFDNKKDFVCGMPISAGIADTVHYNGKVYGFCSTGCKDEFKKNPSAYVSK
ncbi:4-methyl-5(B-hydroxyethyl)-thiazole monophosphate biosynthesis protein [Terrimonas sp.]|uniref:DJ-1/PfpI family protein n=1 Tax=Terrimonas sp. TaxID=1914338 RepID=UPI000D507A2C|nr:DJ-1/PfpI family protein [Terrimonas sp.]PVD53607.1 4-methyl-5(B-hydroxyethyl)-thiazole monophosphate biosynthesis protein [Terrimonas sp.]